MSVPAQPGLAFEIILGLQNTDEVNIGVDTFWSTFFPFERVSAVVEQALDGLVNGDCTVVIVSQFGRSVGGSLQRHNGEGWDVVATYWNGIRLPFFHTSEREIRNPRR